MNIFGEFGVRFEGNGDLYIFLLREIIHCKSWRCIKWTICTRFICVWCGWPQKEAHLLLLPLFSENRSLFECILRRPGHDAVFVITAHTNTVDESGWFDWKNQRHGKWTIGCGVGGISQWNQINRNKLTSLGLIFLLSPECNRLHLLPFIGRITNRIVHYSEKMKSGGPAPPAERPTKFSRKQCSSKNDQSWKICSEITLACEANGWATLDMVCVRLQYRITSTYHSAQFLFNFLYQFFAAISFVVGQSLVAPLTRNSVWSAEFCWMTEKSTIR